MQNSHDIVPDAYIQHEEPESLDAANSELILANFVDHVTLRSTPEKSGSGLFAVRSFATGDTILSTRAGLCRTPDVLPYQLRGRVPYNGDEQHIVNAILSIAATMKAYEQKAAKVHSDRPLLPPCVSIASKIIPCLGQSPSLQVELVINLLQYLYLDPAHGAAQLINTTDAYINNGAHNTLEPDHVSHTHQSEAESIESVQTRVLRFLDGALVAEDVGEYHLVYSHITAYLNHACVPNAILVTALEEQPEPQYPFADIVNVHLKALRPISPDEEITVRYHFGCVAARDNRRRAMVRKLGFECHCYQCENLVKEDLMNEVCKQVWTILSESESDTHSQAYHRSCGKLFDALSRLNITDFMWKDWTLYVASAMELQAKPDWIRSYYFRRQELIWCHKWLGASHVRTKDLIERIAYIRQEPELGPFLKLNEEFITSEGAQQVFFLLDSPPKERLSGKDCIPALEELQARQRKQKKNKASKANKARKKGKPRTATVVPGSGRIAEEHQSGNEMIPATSPTTDAIDPPKNSLPCFPPNKPTHALPSTTYGDDGSRNANNRLSETMGVPLLPQPVSQFATLDEGDGLRASDPATTETTLPAIMAGKVELEDAASQADPPLVTRPSGTSFKNPRAPSQVAADRSELSNVVDLKELISELNLDGEAAYSTAPASDEAFGSSEAAEALVMLHYGANATTLPTAPVIPQHTVSTVPLVTNEAAEMAPSAYKKLEDAVPPLTLVQPSSDQCQDSGAQSVIDRTLVECSPVVSSESLRSDEKYEHGGLDPCPGLESVQSSSAGDNESDVGTPEKTCMRDSEPDQLLTDDSQPEPAPVTVLQVETPASGKGHS